MDILGRHAGQRRRRACCECDEQTRTDDFHTPLLMLMATTVVGAVSGGVLASEVRKSVQNQRRINQLAAIPLFLAVLLVIIVIRLT